MDRKNLVVKLSAAALAASLLGAACGGDTQDPEPAAAEESVAPGSMDEETSVVEEVTDGVDSGAAQLSQALTAGLQEHEYLAGIAVAMGVGYGLDSPAFEGAAAALDANSVDLADAIESIYGPEAGKAFLDSWRKHIGFFVDYTAGQATGDQAKVEQARENLDGYRKDFGALIEGATEGALPAAAVADALKPHVNATFTAIDAVVGVKEGNPFLLLKKAAAHMPHISDALSGAIAGQFPEKFEGDPASPASDLLQTLTAGLQEHEYLAGIAVVQALTNEGNVESPQFQAAAAALDANSVDLANAIESVYGPEAGKAFLDSWRKHIGFFVDYTLGKATGDNAMAKRAKKDLDGYRQDFGALIEGATGGILPADAVAEALIPHVAATLKAIDSTVAFTSGEPKGNPFLLLKEAAAHMPHIATTLAGAIVQQFPDKF